MGSVDGLSDADKSSETKMMRASESNAPTALRKRATLVDAAAGRRSPKAGHVWAAASRKSGESGGGPGTGEKSILGTVGFPPVAAVLGGRVDGGVLKSTVKEMVGENEDRG
jgi:hypothetical protein